MTSMRMSLLDELVLSVVLLSALGVLLSLELQPARARAPTAIPAVSNRRIFMVFSFSTASRGLFPTGDPWGRSTPRDVGDPRDADGRAAAPCWLRTPCE